MTSGATALLHARQSFAVLLPRFDRRCWRARSDLFIVASLAGRGDVRKHAAWHRHMLEHELGQAHDACEKCRCVGETRGVRWRSAENERVVRVSV